MNEILYFSNIIFNTIFSKHWTFFFGLPVTEDIHMFSCYDKKISVTLIAKDSKINKISLQFFFKLSLIKLL